MTKIIKFHSFPTNYPPDFTLQLSRSPTGPITHKSKQKRKKYIYIFKVIIRKGKIGKWPWRERLINFFFYFLKSSVNLDSEILSNECLTKLPVSWHNVPRGGAASVTRFHPKRKWLPYQHCVWLPVLAPVTAHAHPGSPWPFHVHPQDIPCTRHVGDQNQVEVAEPVYCEPDSSLLAAWYPA